MDVFIIGFRIWRYRLPLRSPVFLRRGEQMGVREGFLLELTGEGGEAFWGEAAPLPGFSRESLGETARELEVAASRYIAAISSDTEGFDEVFEDVELVADAPPSVRFALDLARSGFSAASDDITLPEAVGSDPRDSLAVCGLLAGTREEVLAEAAEMRAAGYEAVKLKVGRGSMEGDAALTREVRETLGGGVALRLDANRAWSFEDAASFARLVEDMGLEFVEEPLEEPGRLRELSEATGLPVALDESLVGMDSREVSKHPYARAFVLKPMLLGFIESQRFDNESIMIGRSATAGNGRPKPPKTVVSASYESGVGTLGLISLATSMRTGAAVGLDTYRRLEHDLLHPPLDLAKPRLEMSEVFGVRREVDYERLERVV